MWFRQYPVCAEESSGEGAGSGAAVAEQPGTTESSGATTDAVSPLHWAAALPDDLQGLPIVKESKSLTEFVKSAETTKRFVGDSIRVPKAYDPVAGPAEGIDLTPMFAKLGRPEKPSDYTIDRGEIPEGITLQVNPDEERQFLEEAHAAGLAPWQVNRLARWHTRNEIAKANRAAAEQATEIARGRAHLYEMHGANTPHVEEDGRFVVELMGRGMWGTPELSQRIMEKLDQKGVFVDPDIMTGLAALGSQMRGGRYLGAEQPIGNALTPAETNSRITALIAKMHAGGLTPAEQKEYNDLYELKARYQAA